MSERTFDIHLLSYLFGSHDEKLSPKWRNRLKDYVLVRTKHPKYATFTHKGDKLPISASEEPYDFATFIKSMEDEENDDLFRLVPYDIYNVRNGKMVYVVGCRDQSVYLHTICMMIDAGIAITEEVPIRGRRRKFYGSIRYCRLD